MRHATKFFLAVIMLSILFIVGCATGGMTRNTQAQVLEDVTPDEAYKLIQKNENNPHFTVLDVRTDQRNLFPFREIGRQEVKWF